MLILLYFIESRDIAVTLGCAIFISFHALGWSFDKKKIINDTGLGYFIKAHRTEHAKVIFTSYRCNIGQRCH